MWKRILALSPRARVLVASLAALYIATLLLWALFPGAYSKPAEWHPYEVIRTTVDVQVAARQLRDAGVETVVSPDSTNVFVTRFSRIEEIALSEALEQLDVLDPRRDPFINELSRYFRGEQQGEHLLYVLPGGPRRELLRKVRSTLGPDAGIVSASWARRVSAAVIFLGSAAVLFLAVRRDRLTVALMAPPWLPFVVTAGMPGGLSASLMLLAFVHGAGRARSLIERTGAGANQGRETARAGAYPALVLLLSIAGLVTMAGARMLVPFFPSLIGAVAAATALLFLGAGGSAQRDHELFTPVSLFNGRIGTQSVVSTLGSRPLMLLGVVGALAILPPILDLVTARLTPEIPRKAEATGSQTVTFQSIQELWQQKAPGELPDIADYLAHRAYQQALPFGRGFAPPTEGEAVTLSRFRETESGSYERFTEEVLVFDRAWLSGTLQGAPAGIPQILTRVAGGRGVVPGRERSLYSGYSQLLKHSALVLLAFLPVVISRGRVPGIQRRRSRVIEIARRRKQVA